MIFSDSQSDQGKNGEENWIKNSLVKGWGLFYNRKRTFIILALLGVFTRSQWSGD